MKIFARKRLWLWAIPLLLMSAGLWRVQEARSYVPRVAPLYVGSSPSANLTQLPIVWRANGVWIMRPDAANSFVESAQKRVINWNRAPIALHFPDDDPNIVKAIGADGREVLKVTNGTLELWRAGKKQVTQKTDPSKPSALAIAPDGTRWAVASYQYGVAPPQNKDNFSFDGVYLWNAQSKSQITRLYAKLGNVTALEFSPDSRHLAAVAADGWAFIWNARDGKLVRKWRAHPWVAATLAWSPDSQTLTTGANPRLGLAGNWRLSIANGMSVSAGSGFNSGLMKLDSRTLQLKGDAQNNLTINGQTDRSLRLWNAQTGQLLHNWESASGICSAQFSPDGREIAVGTHGEGLIFDAATLTLKRRLPMKDYPQWPASVAWSPNGATLAVACAPQLTLWRAH